MEVSISEIIRETRNAVNYRLDMLESIIKNSCKNTSVNDNTSVNNLTERIYNVESTLYRFNDLLSNVIDKIKNMEKNVPSHDEIIPEVVIEENTDKPIVINEVEKPPVDNVVLEEKEEIKEEEEVAEEEEEELAEEEEEEVAEEEEEEAEEEEEEAEEEEEGEQMELEEFEYKGMTLYRDTENKVYQMDEEGSLSDPIGIWDESGPKPRIKKLIL